jgi:hypothetical protein
MSIFSESDKKLSYSRILGTLIILWQIVVQSRIMWVGSEVLDLTPNWLMLIVGLYGLNKLSDAYKNKKG